MLTEALLEKIISGMKRLRIGVVGDLFLDRYLDLDAGLTEPSLETGLDAYQVVGVRPSPGAAGTVINNLAAFGVGSIRPLAFIGDDGEGYELRQALKKLAGVECEGVLSCPERRTPTYTKPMLAAAGQMPRELNRLDIKNRRRIPDEVEKALLERLPSLFAEVDGLLVLDQVSEADCGVVTTRMRTSLETLCDAHPNKVVLVDSRERIGLFRSVILKPNDVECRKSTGSGELRAGVEKLARHTGRPVFCTRGERGMAIVDPTCDGWYEVPGYKVTGPIDTVGAGDSISAALVSALVQGVEVSAAGAFANLVASITIQQLGTTGTAPPDKIRARWQEAIRR